MATENLTVKVGANIRDFERKMGQMQSKMDNIGRNMQSIGTKMSAAITVPLVAAGGYAIKTGMDFDDAMAKVSAVSGATGGDLEALRDKAKNMGATTKFSASEAAEGLNYMALAGWSTDEMLDGLDGVMNLAAASGEDLGLVSDIVTDSLSAFGLEAKDSAAFADVLAATSANANTDVAGLGAAFQYVAPVAGALGFTVEDTAKAIGLMSDNGIKGEKAGTALRTMMTNLANPTSAMKDEMDKLGISLTNTDGTMKTFDEIMNDMRSSFSGLTEEQQASAAATIFGKESMSGALAIINSTEDSFDNLGDAINNSEGAAQSMAEVMEDTLGGTWREIKSGIEGLAISIYEAMLPALEKMSEAFLGAIQWLNGLSPQMKQLGVVVGVVAAAIGPLLAIGGTMLIWIGSITKTLAPVIASITKAGGLLKWLAPLFTKIGSVMAALTGPVGLTVAAIAALGAGFVLAYNKSETFRNFIDGLKDKFMGTWESAMEFKDKVIDAISGITAFFKGDTEGGIDLLRSIGLSDETIETIWETTAKIRRKFEEMKLKIQLALDAVGTFFVGAFEDIKAWWEADGAMIFSAMQTVVENVFDGIKIAVGFALTFVKDLFERFAPIVEGIWSVLWPTIVYLTQTAWEKIKLVVGVAMDLVQGIISGVAALIEGDWSKFGEVLKDTAKSIWDRVVEFFGNMKENALTLFGELFSGAKQWFEDLKLDIKHKVGLIKLAVTEGFQILKNNAIAKVTEMYNSVTQWFKDLWSSVSNTASNIKTAVTNRFTEFKDNAISRVKSMFNSVTSWFGDMKTNVSNTASNIKTAVTNRFTEFKDNAVERSRLMYEGVKGWFGDTYTNTKNTASNIRDGVSTRFTKMKENTVGAAKSMWTGVTDFFDDIWDDATSLFDNMVDGAKELPGRIGSAIKSMASKAVDGVSSMGKSLGNRLGSVVNGVVNGLNKVLKAIGVSEIPTISINTGGGGSGGGGGSMRGGLAASRARFSTGTMNGAIAQDMVGIVNDRGPGNGFGGATQELIRRDGKLYAPKGRDVEVNLKRGDEIFNGAQTQSLIASGAIPRFSQGTGTEGGDSGEKKGLLGTLKDVVSNVWSYISDPKTAFGAIIDTVTPDFGGLSGFFGDMASGAFSFLKEKALSWLTGIFKENEGALGSGQKYAWMNHRMTTPYSPNSPVPGYPTSFNGGRHYGVDFATPIGTTVRAPIGGQLSSFWNEGGGKIAKLVTGQLRQFWMHMSSVSGSGSVSQGDIIGRTGNSGRWTTGPHVHYQAQQGSDALNTNTINPLKVINGYSNGGIVTKRQIAEIAEDGPEAVIPLSTSKRGRANQLYDAVGGRIGRDDSKHYDRMINNQQTQIDQMTQAINVLLGIENKSGFDPGKANKAINKHVDDRTLLL